MLAVAPAGGLAKSVGTIARCTKRLVPNVGVDSVIHRCDETREVDMKSGIVCDEAAALHAAMSSERVKRQAKGGDVQHIPHSDHMIVHEDLDGSNAEDGRLCIVGECDVTGGKRLIRGEGLIIRPHVVGCPRVGDEHGVDGSR